MMFMMATVGTHNDVDRHTKMSMEGDRLAAKQEASSQPENCDLRLTAAK